MIERRASNHINVAINVAKFPIKAKVVFCYCLQTIFLVPLLCFYLILMVLPVIFYWKLTNFSWYKCVFGPYLLNIYIWISAFLTIYTIMEIHMAFPYFNPLKGLMNISYYIIILTFFFSYHRRLFNLEENSQICLHKN